MRNRIALLFAATAVLASCMKENSLAPEQTNDNLVTIKAVAAETKTLLGDDGTSVVWEENDAISVVVEGEPYKYLETFTTSSTEKTSIAEFTAVLSNELSADETVTGIGYAVHPATSMTLAGNIVSIVHELPEEQTGTITNGMNLSYAKVDADDIKAGETNAVFYNALTLLKVNVPAGVKSVVLTSNILSPALVGKVNFTVNKTSDDISFVKGDAVSTKRSVTLSNGGAELEEGVHDLLVFPGTANELTLTMTGTDGAVYESTLNAVELVAGTYRTINLTKIFKMGVEDEMFISPAGGECEVKIASVADYTYDVAVTPTAGGNWLSYTLPTKGFHQDVITFSAEENTTGADRTANVTITWGEDQIRTFKMTQRAVYMDFVNDENGDPIQWEESFGVYATEADASNGANATKSYSKKAFTIELSDNPAKGTYMITNMFYADSYYDANLQPATGGAKYYADYTDGVLTVKKNAAGNSYNFSGDISLTYDSANKRFTAAPIPTTSSSVWIGGYTVTVKVEEPEAPSSPYAYLFGDYAEDFADGSYYGNPAKGTLTIAASDNADYDLQMTFFGGTSAAVTVYAKVSDDGTTITTVQPSGYTNMGTFYESTLTFADGVISGTLKFDYPTVSDYKATKKVDWLAVLKGEYAEDFADGSYYGNPAKGTLTIAASDNEDYDLQMTFFGGTSAAVTVYAKVSDDGTTITTVQPSGYTNMGTFYESTLTFADGVISGTLKFDYPTVSDYKATKK